MSQTNRQFGLLWGGVAASLVVVSPLGPYFANWLPRCQFKAILGLPCPGCGTTRSALALSHFDVSAALAANPLATLAWAGLIFGGLLAGVLALADRRVPELPSRLPVSWRWTITLALAANWVYLVIHGS
ncbi:MAG: DUF2752 domain-containing protein [Deltaproteobacteria bacterium]|nr:DUF2752 domain-containing protein [Deltaproteobacteria bacterium]